MFTGIVEEVGTIAAIREMDGGRELHITCGTVREGLALGDSVAVEGVCLTVTELPADGFVVQAVEMTLSRTTVGTFRPGTRVNLERALALGARLGGHLVQGHVDGVGEVVSVTPRGEMTLIDVRMPVDVAAVTVLHGSVTLNGISLTVNALPAPGVLQVAIIPFTWAHTSVSGLRPGDPVNLEGDMIGKYVRHLLGAPARAAEGGEETVPAAPGDLIRAWGYQ